MAVSAPPAKKQKTEEEKADGKNGDAEKPAVPEAPKEQETDFKKDSKPRIKGGAEFLAQDQTLNVMMSESSCTLMSLAEGGMQHLLAGARASVGVKAGRYLFEVKVVEFSTTGGDFQGKKQNHILRIGVGSSASNLFLGDTADSICFDSNGGMLHNKARTNAGPGFGGVHGLILGLVLNLDPSSPNANTVSLFKNGVRASQPQPLPESLKGKALFPMVTYKNVTTHVNFGPTPLSPLPFTCRMINDASAADATVTAPSEPTDGKYEVIFPIGLPDEGTFDRLDQFLQKNPTFTELSDRMILDWAEKSGVWRQKGYGAVSRTNNDKPEKAFGARELDDDSIRRAVMTIAPMKPRNYIVMEVKGNLLQEDREKLLAPWKDPIFKKVADIAVGQPPADYKKKVQQAVLKAKQEKAEKAWEFRKMEKTRQKELAKKKREAEKTRKKMLKAAQKKAAAVKKQVEEAKKKAAEAAKKKAEGEKEEEKEEKDEEMKAEEEKEEEKESESEEEVEEEEPDEPEEPKPKEELTAEEKKLSFRPSSVKDLAPIVLSSNFTKFTLPKKDEGFDDIRCEWEKGAKAEQYLKDWIMSMKVNSRVEELKPSAWFREKFQAWQKTLAEWKSKQTSFKAASSKKVQDRAAKKMARERAAKAAAAKAAAKAKQEELKKAKEAKDAEEGKKPAEPTEKEKEAAAKAAEAATKEAEAEEARVKKEAEEVEKEAQEVEEEKEAQKEFQDLDIFGQEDVTDVSGGMPLFQEFQADDWTLMGLLFELNLMIHAFAHDVDDSERPGIHVDHLSFYYKKYYGKELRPKDFGVESMTEVVNLIGDKVLYVAPKEVLATQLGSEFESFAIFPKLIELARRDRRLRLDLGDEKAVLKLGAVQAAGGGGGGKGFAGKGGAAAPNLTKPFGMFGGFGGGFGGWKSAGKGKAGGKAGKK